MNHIFTCIYQFSQKFRPNVVNYSIFMEHLGLGMSLNFSMTLSCPQHGEFRVTRWQKQVEVWSQIWRYVVTESMFRDIRSFQGGYSYEFWGIIHAALGSRFPEDQKNGVYPRVLGRVKIHLFGGIFYGFNWGTIASDNPKHIFEHVVELHFWDTWNLQIPVKSIPT